MDLINNLKAKYGQSIEAIHTYCGNQKQKLEDLDRYEENFRRAKAEVEKSRAQLEIVSDKLSVIRKKYSQMLTDKIIEGLKDLNFLDVQFHIDFQRKKEYTDNGFDDIESIRKNGSYRKMSPGIVYYASSADCCNGRYTF